MLKKKIAIDTGPLQSGHKYRGIGAMTAQLVDHLTKLSQSKSRLQIEAVDFATSDLTNYDLAHYQWFYPYFETLPDNYPTKALVTIHDLTQLIFPKHYPPGLRGKIRFVKQKKRARAASAIFTISETSKKDIVRFLDVEPEKVFVVHLAARKVFKKLPRESLSQMAKKYNLPNRFVLFVGDVNYNKNLHTLVRAAKKTKLPLVIIGKKALEIINEGMVGLNEMRGPMDIVRFLTNKPHPEDAHFKQLAKQFKNSKDIHILGFVPDRDMVAIYNLATVYCQPSYYEGFGLPVLEAMACGTPVIVSRINAHKEIAASAAVYFNPKSSGDLSLKLTQLIKSSKKMSQMSESGLNLSSKYSWDKAAKDTVKIYKQILDVK